MKLKYTSENPYQQEIEMFYWSLRVIEAFDKGKLTQNQIEKLNEWGFNWGYVRSKLMENKCVKLN